MGSNIKGKDRILDNNDNTQDLISLRAKLEKIQTKVGRLNRRVGPVSEKSGSEESNVSLDSASVMNSNGNLHR